MINDEEASTSNIPTKRASPSGKPTSRVPESPALLPLAFERPEIKKIRAKSRLITVCRVSIRRKVTTKPTRARFGPQLSVRFYLTPTSFEPNSLYPDRHFLQISQQ